MTTVATTEPDISTLLNVDVCGVESGTDRRNCCVHDVCGSVVAANDKLNCQWAIQSIHTNEGEEVVKVFRINSQGEGKGWLIVI